jgi:hypothetical protein
MLLYKVPEERRHIKTVALATIGDQIGDQIGDLPRRVARPALSRVEATTRTGSLY